MRKYIIGFIVGGALTFALQAGAASLLGSTVDAVITVEVDGKSLGQAPVIDGVSYLPVRQFGTEAGYKVDFGEGKATLTNEAPVAVNPVEEPVITEAPPVTTVTEAPKKTHNFTLETIDSFIKGQESLVRDAEVKLKSSEGFEQEEKQKYIDNLAAQEAALARLIAIKAELEAK